MRKPEEITSYELKKGRGYKAEDVDDFLRSVAVDYRKLYIENQSLKEQLLSYSGEAPQSEVSVDTTKESKAQLYEQLKEVETRRQQAEKTLKSNFEMNEQKMKDTILEEAKRIEKEALKDASEVLNRESERIAHQYEECRKRYISFLKAQMETLASENFLFRMDPSLEEAKQSVEKIGLNQEWVAQKVEEQSQQMKVEQSELSEISLSDGEPASAPAKSGRKKGELFQMLNHLNQQMKEDSEAQSGHEQKVVEKEKIADSEKVLEEKKTVESGKMEAQGSISGDENNALQENTSKEKGIDSNDIGKKGVGMKSTTSAGKENNNKDASKKEQAKPGHISEAEGQTIKFQPVRTKKGESQA